MELLLAVLLGSYGIASRRAAWLMTLLRLRGTRADGTTSSTTTTTTTFSVDSSVAAMLRLYSSDNCEGDPHTEINLRTATENHCRGCLDRCSSDSAGFRSVSLQGGPGDAAAVAWNCIGSILDTYDSADFARGGLVQANSGCHNSGGGGAVVLCSGHLANGNYLHELSATCGASFTASISASAFIFRSYWLLMLVAAARLL